VSLLFLKALVISGGTLDGLKIFAFGLDGWGNYHFDFMHIFDTGSAADTHSSTQSTNEIFSAISNRSRTKEELL